MHADPYILLVARQGRYRLDAEMVRDNALAVSGLLVSTVGGRSVKPYQPRGYWAHLNFPVREYESDHGEDLYRRGLYTYWCRTFLHPSLLAFDAPTREECTAERNRSNTPTQALVLLNDPIYVEAARVFRRAHHPAIDAAHRRTHLVGVSPRHVANRDCGRAQDPRRPLGKASAVLRRQAGRGAQAGRGGRVAGAAGSRPAELAAWTSIARTILNLHETISRY